VPARAAPSLRAPIRTIIRTATPEAESNLVRILAERHDRALRDWVQIDLAILPNAVTGWIPRDALGDLHTTNTHLVIDRARLTATLYRGPAIVFQAPIGIGTPDHPTPAGTFTVRERLAGFGNPFYGPIAFGTTGRSTTLTDWPGGGFIGIHGTNQPNLIPGRISHGCIRLRNPDITHLATLMPLGTPVTIH
jgi:lipoprotein-anchoring transpeptidase ErfK/SrfK